LADSNAFATDAWSSKDWQKLYNWISANDNFLPTMKPFDPTVSANLLNAWNDLVKSSSKNFFTSLLSLAFVKACFKSSISQSHAIERYLATEFKLIGDTHVEAAQIDSVGEQINDLKQAYAKAKESNDVKKFFEEDLPRSFQAFNKLAETVGSNGFIVGKKLSLADIQLYNFCQSFDDQALVTKALESAKALKAAVNSVPENENLKKWIAERPKTQF